MTAICLAFVVADVHDGYILHARDDLGTKEKAIMHLKDRYIAAEVDVAVIYGWNEFCSCSDCRRIDLLMAGKLAVHEKRWGASEAIRTKLREEGLT